MLQAGCAVLFDTCIWHVALPNTSGTARVGTTNSFSAAQTSARRLQPVVRPEQLAEMLECSVDQAARRGEPAVLAMGRRKAAFGVELAAEEAAALGPEHEAADAWIRRQTGGYSN